ncbi:SGNH hydrolase-type esterase domain-containing protein, partial [Zopfochytrium polystomum]
NLRSPPEQDISVVMAIGDSITAGFGMNSGTLPFTSITEYRGLAFDIGGDSGAVTIPNFLKTYNSGVKGASTGTTSLGATVDVLNVAVSGALIGDMPGQVATLKSAFTSGGYSASGWKMLGVLIGANNLCKACNSGTDATNSPAAFEAYFRTTVQALRGNFTNLIVNAYQIFDVSQVYSPQQSSSYCSFAQGLLNECPCSKTDANRALMKSYAQQYNAAMTKVAAEFAGLNDFAVNVQTGVADLIIPAGSDGLNWLAKIDCFHPNQCANQVVAAAAWNNMFQKQGSKTSYQLGAVTPYCPGPTDYFQ